MKSIDIDHLKKVQYKNLDGLNKRWKTYEYLNPHFDIYGDAIKKLEMKGNESILEVGCGSGQILSKIANKGHSGKIVGLDIHEQIFSESHPNIQFIVGSADSLPYPDESFDVVMAFFMIYHLPDPLAAVKEWMRVLKKGGRLVVTAATIKNKSRAKALKAKTAQSLGKQVHPLTANCTFEKATPLIAAFDPHAYIHVYKSELHIPDAKIVLDSIESVRDTFHPDCTDAEWIKAMDAMEKEINAEIKERGFFLDQVERGVAIATKN